VRLSDERSRTLSAEVLSSVWVRTSPRRDARKLARLGTASWHGSPEVERTPRKGFHRRGVEPVATGAAGPGTFFVGKLPSAPLPN
jgi:hypothetical protein